MGRLFADFRERVWEPVKRFEPGLPRLLEACRSWVDYAADPGYAGGCLMSQVTFDYDSRTGAVHDRLAEGRTWWRERLRADLATAIAAGDLPESTDIDMVLFGCDAVTAFVTPSRFLHGDGPQAGVMALRAMRTLLGLRADGTTAQEVPGGTG